MGVGWGGVPRTGSPDFNIFHQEAESAVGACRLRPPPQQPVWTVADVPSEIIAQIEAEVQGGDLPDGYFSTNAHYIDVDGNRSKNHPELDARLAAYVAHHNAQVESRNVMFL